MMRITQGVMTDNFMRNLQKNMERLDRYNEQLSSGKKFRFPSQDPIGAARSMNYSADIDKSEQFEKNIDQALSWMQTSESAMDDSNQVMQRARELTVQGANDTLTAGERENLAAEMTELRDELISIAEARHGDRHVFSGQMTDRAPFDEDGNYQGDHKNIIREVSPGVEMPINVNGEEAFGEAIDALDDVISDLKGGAARVYSDELEPGTLITADPDDNFAMTISIDGEEVEIGNDVIEAGQTRSEFVSAINDEINDEFGEEDKRFVRLRGNTIEFRSLEEEDMESSSVQIDFASDDDLVNNSSLGEALFADADYTIGETVEGGEGSLRLSEDDIATFDEAIDSNLTTRAELGARVNRLEMTERRLEDNIINMRELLSENEDTDMAKAIMELRMEESVYQASLATGARVMQPTLVDFLQ